jgi:hypothetical protein
VKPASLAELGLTKQQNRCIEVVALVEKKIGQEVEKGRADNTILKARQNRNHAKSGSRAIQTPPASAAELGLEKHHLRAGLEMANVPVEGKLLKAHQRRPWESSGGHPHQNSAVSAASI